MQVNLRRHGVKNLPSIIVAAKGLVDYMSLTSSSREKKKAQKIRTPTDPKMETMMLKI